MGVYLLLAGSRGLGLVLRVVMFTILACLSTAGFSQTEKRSQEDRAPVTVDRLLVAADSAEAAGDLAAAKELRSQAFRLAQRQRMPAPSNTTLGLTDEQWLAVSVSVLLLAAAVALCGAGVWLTAAAPATRRTGRMLLVWSILGGFIYMLLALLVTMVIVIAS